MSEPKTIVTICIPLDDPAALAAYCSASLAAAEEFPDWYSPEEIELLRTLARGAMERMK